VTPHGFFITGTDTGVGKTLVACALLHALARAGLRAVGMKPVAAGARLEHGRLVNDDVNALKAAGNVVAPDDLVNPYCFEPPVAPHIAAAATGVPIDLQRLRNAYPGLAALADCVVVEGAGGFRVPLGADFDTADLAAHLDLPVLLVVGMRLGCINHALLTAAAVRAAGLPLAGWIANHIEPDMRFADENVRTLQDRLRAPLLARIAYSTDPRPETIAYDFGMDSLLRTRDRDA
jgi:dethiobiotin synthetase